MKFSKLFIYLLTSVFVFMLAGCSSTPSHNESTPNSAGFKYKGAVSEVTIDFSQDAENAFNSNNLDIISLNTTILDSLDSKGLISSSSEYALSIVIDKANIHSKNATNHIDSSDPSDSILGTLVVKDKNQRTISEYNLLKEFRSGALASENTKLAYSQFADHASNLLVEKYFTSSGASVANANDQKASNTKQSNRAAKFFGTILGLLAFAAGFSAAL